MFDQIDFCVFTIRSNGGHLECNSKKFSNHVHRIIGIRMAGTLGFLSWLRCHAILCKLPYMQIIIRTIDSPSSHRHIEIRAIYQCNLHWWFAFLVCECVFCVCCCSQLENEVRCQVWSFNFICMHICLLNAHEFYVDAIPKKSHI